MTDVALLNEQKKLFALEYLRDSKEPYKAAFAVFPQDPGQALLVSSTWPHDPEVKKHMEALKEEFGETHFLPTKAEYARKVFDLAETCRSPEDKIAAYKLYGSIMGYIEKSQTNINTNILTQNKVMLVKDFGSDSEWEQKALNQQEILQHDARH